MRAKSHDQRKGQWLLNKIRLSVTIPDRQDGMEMNEYVARCNSIVELHLWNMENDEFNKLMNDYNE